MRLREIWTWFEGRVSVSKVRNKGFWVLKQEAG